MDRETIIEQMKTEQLSMFAAGAVFDFTKTPKRTMFRSSKLQARASRGLTQSLGNTENVKDKWRLIRVEPSGVVVEKEF